jgi:hypothetical protein
MSAFEEAYENSSFSIWNVCSCHQTVSHLASKYGMKSYPHIFPFRHVTIWYASEIPPSFAEIYASMKTYNRRFGGTPESASYFDLILHGRSKWGVKAKVRYLHGARMEFSQLGDLTISKINRSIPPLVRLINSSAFLVRGVKIDNTPSPEEALANAKKRLVAKRVLRQR